MVLASEKLREYASDTIIWVLQRGATAEGMGEGSVPGRPRKVLLIYKSSDWIGNRQISEMLWLTNMRV